MNIALASLASGVAYIMQNGLGDESSQVRPRRRVFFEDDDEVDEQHALSIAEAEAEYNRHLDILEQFEEEGKWSGNGEKYEAHIEDLDTQLQDELRTGSKLKKGGFGVVSKITYRGVNLVRKTIPMTDFTRDARKVIRQEGSIGQRLDSHRHIIKLLGTFWEAGDDPNRCTFNILTFPVAVRDLEQMLEDCEEFSAPKKTTPLERNAVLERLNALDFNTNRTSQEIRTEMRLRLQEIMGCLTEKCQHRDIKPANILVRPGRVLITDFGIARNRSLVQNTTPELFVGGTIGYMAPEVLKREANNPEHTDIYALGCVFLRILSVIYAPNQQLTMIKEQPHPHRDRFRERQFKEFIAKKGVGTPHQIVPYQSQSLIAAMLDDDRHQRPAAMHVNAYS